MDSNLENKNPNNNSRDLNDEINLKDIFLLF